LLEARGHYEVTAQHAPPAQAAWDLRAAADVAMAEGDGAVAFDLLHAVADERPGRRRSRRAVGARLPPAARLSLVKGGPRRERPPGLGLRQPGETGPPGLAVPAWRVASVGEAEVHRAVSCLGDVHAVRGARSGFCRSRSKTRGRPAERTRGAVLQALLAVES